ncbi:hypothetical protein H920_07935 [Fukomys damarensis]|uniref:Uncharacterized protein n=1 Tax=Fukomys damarensis TaxID=885580 RepID=A0A091DKC6_FUKDA|nr:hypothetical protein H920_07935 [Fukomys damarensis]
MLQRRIGGFAVQSQTAPYGSGSLILEREGQGLDLSSLLGKDPRVAALQPLLRDIIHIPPAGTYVSICQVWILTQNDRYNFHIDKWRRTKAGSTLDDRQKGKKAQRKDHHCLFLDLCKFQTPGYASEDLEENIPKTSYESKADTPAPDSRETQRILKAYF